MIENLTEFWYLWLAAVVLAGVTVFVAVKASKASKLHNETVRRQEEEIKRLKYLSDKYSELTLQTAESSDAMELIEGIAAVLQKKTEKSGDCISAFNEAEEYCRKAYAVKYFLDDIRESGLSFWCRNNDEPLISLTFEAMSDIGETDSLNIMRAMYPMFDKNDDAVSYDKDRVAELDGKFSSVFSFERTADGMKKYIAEQISRNV